MGSGKDADGLREGKCASERARSASPQRGETRRWAVLAVASALIFVVYLMQYQIAALAYVLVPAYGLSSVELSNLMFAPMLLAAVAGIPLGALADRFGVRLVVGLSLIATIAGALLRVFASSYEVLVAASLLLGFAPAALNSNVMKLLGAWFGDRTSFAIGVYYACSGLGASAAMLTSGAVSSAEQAFAGVAAAFALVLGLWFLLVRNAPRAAEGVAKAATGVAKRVAPRAAKRITPRAATGVARAATASGTVDEACAMRAAEAVAQHDRPPKRRASASPSVADAEAGGTILYLGMAARHSVVWLIAIVTGLGLASKTAFLGFLPQALMSASSAHDANLLASFVTYGGIAGCALGPVVCMRSRHPKRFVVLMALVAAALMGASSLTLDAPSALLLLAAGASTSLTAPVVEAIPCALVSLRSCVGSAGGIIGSASLAMSYFIPLGITALSGGNTAVMVMLTGACFLLTIPFLLALPGLTPETVRAALRDDAAKEPTGKA